MTLRIRIVAPFFGQVTGGVERHAEELSGRLRERGHTVELSRSVSTARRCDSDWVLLEGIDRRALLRGRSVGSRPRVGLFTHGSFLPVARAAELRQRGWTPSAADRARAVFDRTLMAGLLGSVDRIFTLSRTESADLAGLFPGVAGRLVAVPNVPRLDPEPPRPTDPGPYVAAVSRVDRRKNFSVVVEALAGTRLGFRLAGADSGDLARIQATARRLGYEGLRYLGPVNTAEGRALLAGAVAAVLPSYFEGVPYMAMEAAALGTPTLLTDLSYLDPSPGIVGLRPDPTRWREQLLAWADGARPAPTAPPGPAALQPFFQLLEGDAPAASTA